MERLTERTWRDARFLTGLVLITIMVGTGAYFLVTLLRGDRMAEANAVMLASPAPIDGQRAFGYLKQICEIGPRIAGSEANARQRKLVADHFTKHGARVSEQSFEG